MAVLLVASCSASQPHRADKHGAPATTTYQNNANNETTITLSNGKTLHANYNPISGCGNFDNGQVTLKAGATSTGCVTFQIPKGQKATQVGYSNTVFPGKNARWQIS